MSRLIKYSIALLVICLFGVLRWPIEENLTQELREENLLMEKVDSTTYEKLGQTGAFVAFGGLRSFVGSFIAMRAHNFFENREWIKLEEAYGMMTVLEPHNLYYWDSGSWQLAYNAYADYENRRDIPAPKRRIMKYFYLEKGIDFLKKGIRQNPHSLRLKKQLVETLTNNYKPNDYKQAIEVLRSITSDSDAPALYRRKLVYCLAHIPVHYEEAFNLAVTLYHEGDYNRTASLVVVIFSLQEALDIPIDQRLTIPQLFKNDKKALREFSSYYNRPDRGFPMQGIREAIIDLEKKLSIPTTESFFRDRSKFMPSHLLEENSIPSSLKRD